eukprot:6199219-Pleurochrysis_carterae.AAC.3
MTTVRSPSQDLFSDMILAWVVTSFGESCGSSLGCVCSQPSGSMPLRYSWSGSMLGRCTCAAATTGTPCKLECGLAVAEQLDFVRRGQEGEEQLLATPSVLVGKGDRAGRDKAMASGRMQRGGGAPFGASPTAGP